jgi:hypothetical protein
MVLTSATGRTKREKTMRRKNILLILGALSVIGLMLPAEAEAQYRGGYGYGPRPARPQWGFRHRIHGYVGGQLTGLATVDQRTDYQTGGYLGGGGGGGGLFGGVRLGPFFSLELNWNITWHNVAEDYSGTYWEAFHLQTVELDGKLHIPTRGIIEPYVQLGLGYAFIGVSWDDSYAYERGDYMLTSGFCFNLGGGLDVWLSPWFTIGGRLLYKGMRFGEPYEYETAGGGTAERYANYASVISVDLTAAIHF